jgi:membrane protease YdiL (CAAX protease family)
MTSLSETTSALPVHRIAPVIPYVAVVVGMYLLNSAWASILLYHLGMAAVLTATRQWKIGRLPQTTPEILVMAAIAIASAGVGLLIYYFWFLIRLDGVALDQELMRLGLVNAPWFIFIVYYFTVNPVFEEIFWRGYLGNPQPTLTRNDVFFAGYHVLVVLGFARWPWIIASFVALMATAWFWRQLARRYRGVFIPIISHAAADAGIIFALYFLIN